MRFFRTPSILPLFYPSLLWRIDTDQKDIYLTFDDGPIPGPTEFVLETLKSFQVKATFFCIGDNIRKHPEIYQRVSKAGHAVGNHTFNHMNGWRATPAEYLENVRKTPLDVKLFRPPFGRIKRSQISLLTDYKIVMWDVLTYDYDRSLDAEKCLTGALKAVRPGSIVVFHDSIKAEKNLTYVLPKFVDGCLSKGYSFKTL